MADETQDVQPESEDVTRKGSPAAGGWRFGAMPGRKDATGARAAIRQREIVGRGTSPDAGNPTPPADVGTGHIGLGPAETEPEEER